MYMDRKMKRWELALMCGVLCALALGGWLDREQERLVPGCAVCGAQRPKHTAGHGRARFVAQGQRGGTSN